MFTLRQVPQTVQFTPFQMTKPEKAPPPAATAPKTGATERSVQRAIVPIGRSAGRLANVETRTPGPTGMPLPVVVGSACAM